MRAARRTLARTIRALKVLARDGRVPRPLRWLVAVSLLPVPGPFDEAVLLLAAAPMLLFYRQNLREAWDAAEPAGGATS